MDKLIAIQVFLVVLTVHLFAPASSTVDDWISERWLPHRSIAGIFESSPVGLRYNRGFPRGIWGTNLAPDLGRYDENNQSFLLDGFFWNRARSWLSLEEHWQDPQKAYDVFREKVFNYMCNNDTWTCCTAGIMDLACRSPPSCMQEIIYLFMDPVHNMPVLFLYWWCAQQWRQTGKMASYGCSGHWLPYCRVEPQEPPLSDPPRKRFSPVSQLNARECHDSIKFSFPQGDFVDKSWVNYREWSAESMTPSVHELKHYLLQYCPSPCVAKPCRHIPGVEIPNSCNTVGPFEDDYECICRKDFQWDQSTQTCKPINPCFSRSYVPCSPVGALACVALNMQTPLCICRPEYTGKDCGQLRNACLTRFNKSDTNGNTNCGVAQGNICNPILGTDFYKCTCAMGWAPSPMLSYDNCDVLNDPCGAAAQEERNISSQNLTNEPKIRAVIDCQNGGYCSSSPDNTKAACLCPSTASGDQGFTGSYCEIAHGMWSGWTEFTECRGKACGISRYKWRRRQCLNETIDIEKPDAAAYLENSNPCFGISEELQGCEEALPCQTLRLSGYYRREIFYFPSLFVFLAFLLVELLLTLILFKTCGPRLACHIIWKIEKLVAKKEEECVEIAPQTVMYICEAIPRSEAQDILSRSSSPEIFIEDKVEPKCESSKNLDDEQYLELIRQRIIQRILELIESREKETTDIPKSTLLSKASQLWRLSKDRIIQLRSQLPSAIGVGQRLRRWAEIAVKTAGTETNCQPNKEDIELKCNEIVEDNRVMAVDANRELKKTSFGGAGHQLDEGRKRFIIHRKQPSQPETVLLDSMQVKTPSLSAQLASLSSISQRKPSNASKSQEKQSQAAVSIEKTKLFKFTETSDKEKNLHMRKADHEAKDRVIEQKELDALKSQKRKFKKPPKLKLKPLVFISDTLDQISSSEFGPESDCNESDEDGNDAKTLTPQISPGELLPEVYAISPNMEASQTDVPIIPKKSEISEMHPKQMKGASAISSEFLQVPSQVPPKDDALIKEPTKQTINERHSSIFIANEPRRITRVVTGPKLPANPEYENPVPVSVTSINSRIRKMISLEELVSSSQQSQKNAEEQKSAVIDGPNIPPTPLRATTSSPITHCTAITAEVSAEESTSVRRQSNEDAHEAPSKRKNPKSL